MMHLQKEASYHDVAAPLGVEKETVIGWLKRFKKEGLDGLRESPRSGAKKKLPTEQEAEFKAAIIELQEARKGGSITGQDIQQLLSHQFQVTCGLSSAYNYLHRVGLSWITVRSKHPKQASENQEAFKKTFNP